jgi:acyl transferase domain-containing protein
MLQHRQWVPFLSGQQPMKHYDMESSPFYFCRKLTEWTTVPRIAAINCFADGGTNAHVILEAWKEPASRPIKRQPLPPPQLHRYDVRYAEVVTSPSPQENQDNKKAQKKPNKGEHAPLLKQLQSKTHRVTSTWKKNKASNQVTSTWKKNNASNQVTSVWKHNKVEV